MPTLSSLSREASRLWAGLQGEVILPGQPRYNEARQAFNPAADQEPAAVVFAESAHDMVAAVTFAAGQGRQIAAQGSGRNAVPLRPLTETILLKTERMRGVTESQS
jgi:FAD/FMN-containing dehydrogenase